MNNPLAQKTIILGVTGSIAAYKAADLASKLAQSGAQVDVILTAAATQFVTPLTFQSVTGRRAYTDSALWSQEGHVVHVDLGHRADLVVIAPATANTIARLANGLADNLLCVTALAARCPLLIAPAMDGGMYDHPATQHNLQTLRERGALVIGPASGRLASGLVGEGRMVEPAELLGHIRLALSQGRALSGRKVIVTAGGTQEPLDPVRTLTNRSSGKQGYALAQAALDLGAEVLLVSAPTQLEPPAGAQVLHVQTAWEMLEAVRAHLPTTHILLMAAAVADFKPAQAASQKIKKDSGPPEIVLEPTADILKAVAEYKARFGLPLVTVGFAAESQNLLDNARAKLEAKKLDLIAANDITAADAGFSADTNRITLLDATGGVEQLPLLPKPAVAETILQRVVNLLHEIPDEA